MKVEALAIPDVKLFTPSQFPDDRGFFSELWSARSFAAAGLTAAFVQDNYSLSTRAGTIRGLHFQKSPYHQGKLVRVSRGSIFDVAVDIRRNSPTFGQHAAAVISAASWSQMWVPVGFAHGFCTLEPDTEVVYKVTSAYAPESACGIAWDDPGLGIAWPVAAAEVILSERDRHHPRLAELSGEILYSGEP